MERKSRSFTPHTTRWTTTRSSKVNLPRPDYDPFIKSQLTSTQSTFRTYLQQIWSRNTTNLWDLAEGEDVDVIRAEVFHRLHDLVPAHGGARPVQQKSKKSTYSLY